MKNYLLIFFLISCFTLINKSSIAQEDEIDLEQIETKKRFDSIKLIATIDSVKAAFRLNQLNLRDFISKIDNEVAKINNSKIISEKERKHIYYLKDFVEIPKPKNWEPNSDYEIEEREFISKYIFLENQSAHYSQSDEIINMNEERIESEYYCIKDKLIFATSIVHHFGASN